MDKYTIDYYIIDYIKYNKNKDIWTCRIKNQDWDLYDILQADTIMNLLYNIQESKKNIIHRLGFKEVAYFNF